MNAKKLVRQNWEGQEVVSIETKKPIWNHFYMISPLVIIGTKEKDHYDLAPKHMAMATSLPCNQATQATRRIKTKNCAFSS